MKVTSSASIKGRTFGVELSEEDVVPWTIPAEIWEKASLPNRHRMMMQQADLLVVRYMWEAELVTSEYAQQRLREIRLRSAKGGA